MSMIMFLEQLRALLKPKCMRSEESDVSASNQIRVLKFSYTEIQSATNNFRSELTGHQDRFCPVYEGTLPSGAKVTVKRLAYGAMGPYSAPFHFRHPRIVSLIGFCDERGEMIIVYEYVEKGDLRDLLYGRNSEGYSVRSNLSWEQRLQICVDSAEAIHYLHSRSDERVIHRDVKSANILVDGNLRAKLTVFGIDTPRTMGYLDPECWTSGFTEKSDVYSFGVVLLEVLCARPALLPNAESREPMFLAEWGMLWHRKGELERFIDPVLVGNINSASFKIYCETIELCLRKKGRDRPGIREVLWNLEMALELQLY